MKMAEIALSSGTALTAFAAGCALTPLVRSTARRWGLMDQPDPVRKLHEKAIPLGGGAAVLGGVLVALAAAAAAAPAGWRADEPLREWAGFLAAALLITCLGLVDDARGLRGRQKLAGQLAAGGLLCLSGMTIQRLGVFGWEIELGLLAVPFTLFWILGAINAVNLLDGADGVAAMVGLVLCAALAAMALSMGHRVEATVAAALAGALAAFLLFNFPPASIFLGDAGSMLIGLAIGVLAIRTSLKGPTTVALAAPAALLSIPLFDCAVAIVRRRQPRRFIYTTDRSHLHHCLLRKGAGARGLVLWIAALCGVTAAGALASVFWRNEPLALATAGAVILALVSTRVFGFGELLLVVHQALAFAGSLLAQPRPGARLVRQQTTVLQGSRDWGEIWSAFTEFAELHQLCSVRLNVHLAWMHEGFHAHWQRRHNLDPEELWSVRMPLTLRGRKIGCLEIAGQQTGRADYQILALVAELLEALEPCLLRLVGETAEAPAAVAAAAMSTCPR